LDLFGGKQQWLASALYQPLQYGHGFMFDTVLFGFVGSRTLFAMLQYSG